MGLTHHATDLLYNKMLESPQLWMGLAEKKDWGLMEVSTRPFDIPSEVRVSDILTAKDFKDLQHRLLRTGKKYARQPVKLVQTAKGIEVVGTHVFNIPPDSVVDTVVLYLNEEGSECFAWDKIAPFSRFILSGYFTVTTFVISLT